MDVLHTLYMPQHFSDQGWMNMYMYTAHRKFKQDKLSALNFETRLNCAEVGQLN